MPNSRIKGRSKSVCCEEETVMLLQVLRRRSIAQITGTSLIISGRVPKSVRIVFVLDPNFIATANYISSAKEVLDCVEPSVSIEVGTDNTAPEYIRRGMMSKSKVQFQKGRSLTDFMVQHEDEQQFRSFILAMA